jgi:tagatose 6-phosphate kinase
MPILTVSLNAAVDQVYTMEGFQLDRINTVQAMHRMAGGKANNVARVLASLGQSVIATGFSGGSAGHFIERHLQVQGIIADYEPIDGENRTCTTLIDRANQTVTEVREPGPTLAQTDADRFLDRYTRLLQRADMVIISGSLPPGIPTDFYAELIRLAWRNGQVRTILDAAGPALTEALRAQPYLIKPNLDEMTEWAGHALPDEAAILQAGRTLIETGPLIAAISRGAQGLILVSPEGVWRAEPPSVAVVNSVGSGDSLVAGLAVGLMQGLAPEEILRLAVACGTANTLTTNVAAVNPEDLAQIKPRVQVRKLA